MQKKVLPQKEYKHAADSCSRINICHKENSITGYQKCILSKFDDLRYDRTNKNIFILG